MNKTDELIADGLMTPQFLSDEEEALFAEVLLGDEAIRFLNSDLGRVMRGHAQERREAAKEALLTANPDTDKGREAIKAAQFNAAVADQFLTFVRDAISSGEVAHQSLLQMREQA